MPILKKENDMYPESLFSDPLICNSEVRDWWCLYTRSRQEKELARRLTGLKIPHYAPMIPKRYRSPNGRIRTSYIPLFPNYVFFLGNEDERMDALATNCISRCTKVTERQRFIADLQQIQSLIGSGIPMTPEGRLEKGNRVRIKNGPFAGYEGVVLRREGKTRFVLSLHFLQKGVSVEMDEGSLEPI